MTAPSDTPPDGARRAHLTLLRTELEGAPVAAEGAPPAEDAAPDDHPIAHAPAETERRRRPGEIWPDCPVRALGVQGEIFWYLDILGQLAPVSNHTRDRMRGVFGGRSDLLTGRFPSYTKTGKVGGWEQDKCAGAMQRACVERGVWNPLERVRGVGAWPDPETGGVILHCGDAILHQGEWRVPGDLDGLVYPSAAPQPRPKAEGAATAPAELMDLLSTWRWVRGDLDALLMFGWLAAAMFGGALSWRPMMWITGDAGTGKSTLQALIRDVIGGDGTLLQSTDTTEAGLRQLLGSATLPVALDEVEPDAQGSQRVLGVVKLARQAASGGVVLRGGSDHKGQEFRARSCFLFSSILIPSLLDQDISRMALLELRRLEHGAVPPALSPRRLRAIGQGLRARVVAGWPRLHETLEQYRAALARAGHAARGADQYGTLLAMADLALHDAAPDPARADQWARRLDAMVVRAQTDQSSDWQRLATHLMGQPVNTWRKGEQASVASLCAAAANLKDWTEDELPPARDANRMLGRVGLRVSGLGDRAELWVANAHPELAKLLKDTHWQGGVWAQSLRRVPGAQVVDRNTRFAGRGTRYTAVPLREMLGEGDDAPAPNEPPAPPLPDDIDQF